MAFPDGIVKGIDCSEWQEAGLPWPEWYAAGYRIAVCRASIGFVEDIGYERFVTLAHNAGFTIGAYHAILGDAYYEPIKQAKAFVSLIMPQVRFIVLDDEAPGVSADEVAAWVNYVVAHSPLPLVLYGNWNLAAHIAAEPELKQYDIWWAGYPTFPNLATEPPWPWPRNVPSNLVDRVIGWQFAGGNGRLPPYEKGIDLSVWSGARLNALLGSEADVDVALTKKLLALLGQARESENVAQAALTAMRVSMENMAKLLPPVTPDPVPTPGPLFKVRITVPVLNLRSGPAGTFPDIGDVTKGQEFYVFEVAPPPSGWYRIHVTEQRWISGAPAYSVKVP